MYLISEIEFKFTVNYQQSTDGLLKSLLFGKSKSI